MSIVVELTQLAQTLADFGSGYLVTVSAQGQAKVVTVDAEVRDGLVMVPPSRGSAANLATNPAVTLVFPPLQPKGFTLLVDGVGRAVDSGIEVTPEAAVLHRPASHAADQSVK